MRQVPTLILSACPEGGEAMPLADPFGACPAASQRGAPGQAAPHFGKIDVHNSWNDLLNYLSVLHSWIDIPHDRKNVSYNCLDAPHDWKNISHDCLNDPHNYLDTPHD
jgi:hypothetical protein